MKISKIETIPVSLPLKEEAFDATSKWENFNLLFVEVITDNGIVGLGEIAPLHGKEMPIFEAIIKKRLEGRIIGEDPYNLERIWWKMVGKGSDAYTLGRSGAIITAASAIDMALWDIVSKSFDTPLYNLLGGKFRDKVELYLSFMGEVDIDRVKKLKKEGFRAAKFKVGFNLKKDVEKVKRLREELGEEFKIMVDANQGYELDEAIKFSESFENLCWFEEPIDVYNLRGLKILARRSKIPIALGENYYNEFSTIITRGLADIIQPDINHVGGVTQLRRIASLAEVYHLKFAPHLHSILGFVIGLHVLISQPRGYLAEYPIYGERWEERDKIIEKCVNIKDGFCELNCKRGIGIELDDSLKDYMKKFIYP
ncbi:D-galactarolactone cycloisomerase [archaeon HR06]|nr:D-galactarolactone cycloisomerase [archaeon HR06]